MSRITLSTVLVAGLMAMATPAPTGAITYEKLTYLTFNGPVQVPGTTLDAGMYRFRLANPDTSRNVIQVLSHDGSTVHAMFHTIADSRATVTKEAMVTFRETPVGVPPAVQSLFYGGEHHGYAFVYPKGGPVMTAEITPQPPVTYAARPAPVAAIPDVFDEPWLEPMPEPEPMLDRAPAFEQTPTTGVVELPRTASPVPLAALGGFVTLLAGLGAGLLRRRVH